VAAPAPERGAAIGDRAPPRHRSKQSPVPGVPHRGQMRTSRGLACR
jgi:hypothetical protein